MKEFLERDSDFAFELKVMKKLRAIGFTCHHGGTYQDAQTSKLRQFDLRAQIKLGFGMLYLAAECKQIRKNYPLLVLRVPRRSEESFHTVLLTVDRNTRHLKDSVATPGMKTRGKSLQMRGAKSRYSEGDQVGKSCCQVGRDANGLSGTDSEMFGKWTQAICSAQGLVAEAFGKVPTDREGWMLSIVIPLVVVPDGRLWAVDYTAEGSITNDPHQVDQCAYYVSTECTAGNNLCNVQYTFSHLEFV